MTDSSLRNGMARMVTAGFATLVGAVVVSSCVLAPVLIDHLFRRKSITNSETNRSPIPM